MGEIDRAPDTELQRDVAIKVLPEVSHATLNAWPASSARARTWPRGRTGSPQVLKVADLDAVSLAPDNDEVRA
jgi:hypothetical protein